MSEKANEPELAAEGSDRPTRRDLFEIGGMLALPMLMAGEAAAAPGPLRTGPEIYQSIGVEPVINCRGTFTIIGGSVELSDLTAKFTAKRHNYPDTNTRVVVPSGPPLAN